MSPVEMRFYQETTGGKLIDKFTRIHPDILNRYCGTHDKEHIRKPGETGAGNPPDEADSGSEATSNGTDEAGSESDEDSTQGDDDTPSEPESNEANSDPSPDHGRSDEADSDAESNLDLGDSSPGSIPKDKYWQVQGALACDLQGNIKHKAVKVPRCQNPFAHDKGLEAAFCEALDAVLQDNALPKHLYIQEEE
ncbi:hypothetical protein K439DRAFT_1621057 [Ramaria rubella]|nr:hypothetical protein K439DRAFT_1621057 [Ramaria rubella]